MTALSPGAPDLARENAKLRKINAALLSRVERSMDQPANAFGLFEAAISLDTLVRRRTEELQGALRAIESVNAALTDAKRRADDANAFKSSFLAFVGHDLLQPLNAARLGLSSLTEADGAAADLPTLSQVDRALVSLEDLIRTLLDMSKLEAGAMRAEVSAFEIERVLAPLRVEFAPIAKARGLKLSIRRSAAVVESDALFLRRILQNLINNAIRYTRKGGVLLGCRRRGGHWSVEVADSGPGIAHDRREAIFQQFQSDSAEEGAEIGFGLGLTIVRRLALALDHKVDLSSRVGFGSRFSVALPSGRLAWPLEAIAPAPRDGGTRVEGARVLVVENEPGVREAMRDLLGRWRCVVLTAASGAEAIRVALGGNMRPDIIVADLHLDGGERGFDVVDDLRRMMNASTPAVIVTADHSAAATAEAAARGVEILRKPLKPAELRALMAFKLGGG